MWSMNSDRKSGHSSAGTSWAKWAISATTPAVSWRSSSQIMTYLLAKNWYSVPMGTPARLATSSKVKDSNPTSTSTSRAAVRIRA
jgi:hypothetical protein